MRANVHVLTLTATPIPRTLQLALSGVRELSLITTPPLDRLAVRTYISPFDPVIIRESLLREHFRGGQSFYVVPRVTDLDEIAAFLRENVPEVKFRVAHGRMPPTEARRHHDRLLRPQVRRAALDHHRRIRPRHFDRQHAHHPPRRHVRPGPALSVARPRRALEAARLCAVHHARQPHADTGRREAPEGSAVARIRWAQASRWPATISTCAAPAICWATSSPATSRKWATNSISR